VRVPVELHALPAVLALLLVCLHFRPGVGRWRKVRQR
jgi:hypothetical protein